MQHEDGKFEILYMSESGEQLFERPLSKLMDVSLLFSYIHPDDLPGLMQSVSFSSKNLTQWNYEFRLVKLDGRIKWLHGKSNPHSIINEGVYWNGILLDITEYKNSEETLRQRNDMITKLTAQVPGVVYQYQLCPEGRSFFPFSSPGMKDIYEVTPEEVREDATPVFGRLHPDDYDYVYRAIIESAQNLSPCHVEFRVVLPRKGLQWRLSDAMPERMEDGSTLWHGIISDITERKNTEENLRKLSRAVEQSQVSIVITNKEAAIEYVNPKFLEITGYTKEEVIRKNPRILKSGHPENDYQGMWNTLKSNKEWNGILLNKKKNGELFWESVTISPVRNESGELTNYVAVKEDITLKKELELNLQRALERAEESSKLKSSLLANMNHELRTPMTGIMGFTEILKSQAENPVQQNMLELIDVSAKRLMNTLNSVVDFAQMQSSNYEMNKLNINEFIERSVEKFKPAARTKKIKLESMTGDKQIFIIANEKMIVQMLSNLLDNAIKYTNKGSVSISLAAENENSKNYAVIKIKDTGIGIRAEDQEIIFEEFRQASEGLNRSYEGLGLGLTLVKKIVLDVNGKIDVESKINEGSEFKIRIPLVEIKTIKDQNKIIDGSVKNPLQPLSKENSAKKKKILYVEDNALNAMVVKSFLSPKFVVEHAKNAVEGLKKVKTAFYDLLLMDINLGYGMSGIELTRLIREIEEYKEIPIIAITGYAMFEDKEKIMMEGLTDYLAKPFDRAELDEIVLRNIYK
ncbi:PAS domain S-box protein [bacterium]|nr:MAG: PAS domain S-box protein [bacterium]